jgi:hypothetical protein
MRSLITGAVFDAAAKMGIAEGLLELGRAFASLASTYGVPNPKAVAHFTAAGILLGIGAAGLIGAGVMGAMGGGSGGGDRAAPSASAPPAESAPAPGQGSVTLIVEGDFYGDPSDFGVKAAREIDNARMKGLVAA